MPKRSPLVRIPLSLLALLQFSVPAAVAWADARVGEATGPAHIESHSTSTCVRVHPADCALHRFMTAPLARTPSAVLKISEGHGILWASVAAERAATANDLTLPDSRAPPSHS